MTTVGVRSLDFRHWGQDHQMNNYCNRNCSQFKLAVAIAYYIPTLLVEIYAKDKVVVLAYARGGMGGKNRQVSFTVYRRYTHTTEYNCYSD